jgi:serine/threonine protein kinase
VSIQAGTEFKRSKYRILGLVGQGQFGQVFCAVHRQTGRLVALKNLEHQRFPTHKFLRELRFLLSLQHVNIVTCQTLEHTSTGRYLVMDYCEGGTLRSLMTEESHPSLPQSLNLVADILSGLEHAHSRGIVHCDIKPENILLNIRSSGWIARISDFGIAKLSQDLVAQEWGNTGSPAYMAPERFYGQYSPTSDLYSVGIILFELLTGHRPFLGTPAELMSAHLNRLVQLPDIIPTVWQPLILTSLQKLSGRRFRSATEMLAMLRSIAAQTGMSLDSQAIALPFLQPNQAFSFQPGKFEHQELLQRQVDCVAGRCVADRQGSQSSGWANDSTIHLHWAEGNRLIEKTILMPESIAKTNDRSLERERQISLPTTIRELLYRPQGCFAVTQDGVYLISTERQQRVAALEPQANSQIAIESGGLWLAIASNQTHQTSGSSLTFQRLPNAQQPVSVATQPISLSIQGQHSHQLQLLALDSRHVVVISASPCQTSSDRGRYRGSPGTRLEVITRRGDRIGILKTPVVIGQAITTCIPYRLLATDQNLLQSILIIDLKPFRILRFVVEVVPEFLAASPWGYSLIDKQGQIIFLDLLGQRLGEIAGPVNPTAIAPLNPHGLVIAARDGDRGSVHILDLRTLKLIC